ncbi:hypothetical protein [uncultured Clostridium sp.]|uniref:hypothetical protein n=1 Tax=uncultured Clostridium sp. TaxID=59620 RepID=UPI0025FEA58A|nr:hypothetical protein [uncultured Clostridium sp.]
MKKIKHLIIISCISLGVVSTIFVAKDLANDIKNKQEHNNISVEENNISNENSNKVYDLDKELENNKDEFSKDIIIEKGFKTSITNGNSDEEIKKNNFLLDTNKFSLDERIKAKNVAENFVQAIESFDIENIKETVDLAVKYSADELKEEVEALYMYLGKNQDIKKKTIEEVKSYEEENKYDNDYILFDVYVKWNVIDQYDQICNSGRSSYEVKLLKFNNKYKVVSYRVI